MKTPEEMAEEYIEREDVACAAINHAAEDLVKAGFLAGYQAAQPKWISVKERLPEINELVVILHEDKSKLNHRKPPVYFGRWKGADWMEVLDSSDVPWFSETAITHWMPLPKPPEDVKD